MPKQLSLRFEDEWWMEVIISLSEDQKEEAIVALKEMFIAYFEMKRASVKSFMKKVASIPKQEKRGKPWLA
jgi:hypothetical protein